MQSLTNATLFAGTVFTCDEADTEAIVGNPFDVFDESCDLVYLSNLDEVLTCAGHDSGAE